MLYWRHFTVCTHLNRVSVFSVWRHVAYAILVAVCLCSVNTPYSIYCRSGAVRKLFRYRHFSRSRIVCALASVYGQFSTFTHIFHCTKQRRNIHCRREAANYSMYVKSYQFIWINIINVDCGSGDGFETCGLEDANTTKIKILINPLYVYITFECFHMKLLEFACLIEFPPEFWGMSRRVYIHREKKIHQQ